MYPSWMVYHQDRLCRLSGGLVIALCSSWPSSRIIFPNFNLTSEILGVTVFHVSLPINIINVYSSSGNVIDDLTEVCHSISGSLVYFGVL